MNVPGVAGKGVGSADTLCSRRRGIEDFDRVCHKRRPFPRSGDEVIAEKAKAKQSAAGGDKRSEAYKETASIKNDKSGSPVNTQKEIAKLAGVSTGTVAQFEQVQKKAPELAVR